LTPETGGVEQGNRTVYKLYNAYKMKKYKMIRVEEKTHKRIKIEATKKGISIMELLKRDYERH